jgi:hypothetical protein
MVVKSRFRHQLRATLFQNSSYCDRMVFVGCFYFFTFLYVVQVRLSLNRGLILHDP